MKKLLIAGALFFIAAVSFAQSAKVDSGYFSSFDKTKIYYEVHGDGFPVLLIHGFIVNMNSWKHAPVLDSLTSNGFKVILVDLRGNGKSDKPHDDSSYANDAEAKDVMLLMQHLNINNYDVVGYSRGSIITARLLVLDQHVNKTVFGGMGDDFTNPNWPRRIMFYHALESDTVAELHAMVQNVQRQGLDQRALMLMQKYQPSTSKALLQKITKPVLVIHGDLDNDNGSADKLAGLFTNVQTAIVPGDHNHAASTPEFANEVVQFLKK